MKDLQKIRLIFCEALEKETQQERETYLTQACRDDSPLRAEVEALLRTYSKADDFLKVPLIGSEMPGDQLSEGPGTVIGRYKLLEKIGEGGMAVVYMAEQEELIRRKVALKIIKLGMDTKSVIARFEAERQALAMMDHPNIAKVLDAGATETGRPYFVMELVKGVSITDYCDANSLSTKERLDLFIQVCNAVQHAHQKGIIHRDIKPTNVMVTLHDSKPVPKVIDFGIAKAINQKLTEKTFFTRYAHIIGTPAYMSPEQAELSDLDIDTRTDIYSLGVLLYELLTGTPPFGEEELRKDGFLEMQRVIREQEPVKPSTKLSTLGKTLTDIAKHRSSTPDLLRKAFRGDLDWIVMKSLEKDRARRYETANGLALDIRRHLEHEPVLARGPSTTYRLQKFLRRHRSQTVAALAVMVVAGAGAIVLSMWNRDRLQWNRDRLQLAEAEGFRHRGILSQAREQYAKSDREAALETIKPILDSRNVGPEARLLYAGILVDNRRSDEAATLLSNLLKERPEIAGAAHALLARILWQSESPNAEKFKEIDEHRQKAEALLPETAEAYFLRAMTAITVKEQLSALNKALQLDLQHYESRRLRAYTYYASRKYEQMREDALFMVALRPRDPLGYSLRAIALRELGKYMEAIAEYDNAIRLTLERSPQHIDLSTQRCETLLRMGDCQRLIADAEACLKLAPDQPIFQYHIFCALTALGDYDKADAVFREIVGRTPTARNELREWCAKYVFDTLEAGQSWHPAGNAPEGAAFLPMVEAEESYRTLSAKAQRLITDGFSGHWSPDGKKLAFSLGVHGYSGVAIFDLATKETELLIVPGKDPVWSPDGKYIAFVRDCKLLRISEFIAAERREQQRLMKDEEVWVMNADGTQPRRLARGGWPSWSQDSTCVYYQSRIDNKLYSISMTGGNVEPKEIMTCSNAYPSVSSDNQHVVYVEGASLKVRDLSSQTFAAEQPVAFATWGGAAWSPSGREWCIGGRNDSKDRIGLWICSLDTNEPAKILDGQITAGAWTPDRSKLVFSLDPPHFEIWAADLDPNVSTTEALGTGKTIDEHYRDMLAFYNRRIETDPLDAYAYSGRAHYYDYLKDKAKATADMRRWSAVASGRSPSDFQNATLRNIKRIINGPFKYKIVFSAERLVNVNEIPLLNVALGQKGRCNMKTFQVPILSTRGLAMSLLGLCLFSGLDTPPAYADFTFSEPTRVESAVYGGDDYMSCISYDGLEMYIVNIRSGGQGLPDIWVLKRASEDEDWSPAENLGAAVNSPYGDGGASISADGLTLYFCSDRPYGDDTRYNIYVTTRATKNDPWGPAVKMGPEINGPGNVSGWPWISPDGLELYFDSWRSGVYGALDTYVARRATVNDPWTNAVNLGPLVNTASWEWFCTLSPDGLLLLFCDWLGPRPGGYGAGDLWMARRATLSDPWQVPVNLGPMVNSSADEFAPRISTDGRTLYFLSNRNGGWGELQKASIIPNCDFNSDGVVDIADVGIMIEHWHTDYSLCDIGPYAWGDGFVDAQDLIVLAEHLFEVVPPVQ